MRNDPEHIAEWEFYASAADDIALLWDLRATYDEVLPPFEFRFWRKAWAKLHVFLAEPYLHFTAEQWDSWWSGLDHLLGKASWQTQWTLLFPPGVKEFPASPWFGPAIPEVILDASSYGHIEEWELPSPAQIQRAHNMALLTVALEVWTMGLVTELKICSGARMAAVP